MPSVDRVTSEHTGRRVVLRYRCPEPDGPTFTDVVGVLERFDSDSLTVRNRRDELVTVLVVDVFLAKPIEERPPRPGRPA